MSYVLLFRDLTGNETRAIITLLYYKSYGIVGGFSKKIARITI